jgi:Family of unknown function (DUF6488)
MKIKAFSLSIILGLFSCTVMAGGGHDHGHGHSHAHTPVNQVTAKANATKIVVALTQRKKLDESWASITASSVEKKVFKGNPEWVVIFNNDKIADPAKQKLYVFLTLGGDYIAANFSGK